MTNPEASCPECGGTDISQEILVVGAEVRSLRAGDVVAAHTMDYCEEIGVAECTCDNCDHQWTVDREKRVVGKEVFVGRIATPDHTKWNGIYVGASHDAVLARIANYARESWQGENALPDDDEYAIEIYFGDLEDPSSEPLVDDERYEPLRADTEDYDIIRLSLEVDNES